MEPWRIEHMTSRDQSEFTFFDSLTDGNMKICHVFNIDS